MNNMILGRYIPGNSIIHQLDPRGKLLSMFLFIFLLFWANNLQTNILLFCFIFVLMYLTRISIGFYVKGLKSMIFIIAFTTVFQLFATSQGTLLYQWWFFKLTDQGLAQAAIIFCRFILIIFYSTILTVTTTPLSLADAVEKILTPLKIIKVPAHEIGLMLSMSLRFVPTLVDDTNRIMNAQRARGVDFGEGNLLKRIRSNCDGSERLQRWGGTNTLSDTSVGSERYPSIARYSVFNVIRFLSKKWIEKLLPVQK